MGISGCPPCGYLMRDAGLGLVLCRFSTRGSTGRAQVSSCGANRRKCVSFLQIPCPCGSPALPYIYRYPVPNCQMQDRVQLAVSQARMLPNAARLCHGSLKHARALTTILSRMTAEQEPLPCGPGIPAVKCYLSHTLAQCMYQSWKKAQSANNLHLSQLSATPSSA